MAPILTYAPRRVGFLQVTSSFSNEMQNCRPFQRYHLAALCRAVGDLHRLHDSHIQVPRSEPMLNVSSIEIAKSSIGL